MAAVGRCIYALPNVDARNTVALRMPHRPSIAGMRTAPSYEISRGNTDLPHRLPLANAQYGRLFAIEATAL